MNMLELFKKYSCEKIWHSYNELYEADSVNHAKTDKHIRSRNFRGESINVWLEYFTNANIYTH